MKKTLVELIPPKVVKLSQKILQHLR